MATRKIDNSNVWDKFSFSDKKQKSALDYLNEFKTGLTQKTNGELNLDVEGVDAYIDTEPPRLAAIYMLYVVAPNLGNFRRKILTVAEYSESGRFPVDIVNHFIDNKKISAVEEENFKKTIDEILSSKIVRNSIENLYQQSVEFMRTKGENTPTQSDVITMSKKPVARKVAARRPAQH